MLSEVAERRQLLLERDAELLSLEKGVGAAAGGRGSVVVLEGGAGLGKTELLRVAGEQASAAGLRVLRGRGTELDRDFAFGLVRQLLERAVAEDPELLAHGASAAADVLARVPGDERSSGELFAALHGLYWLVVNLAARGPVALLVDDVHWADTVSIRWLVFLAERVDELPVLLVAAARPDEPGADRALLDALAGASPAVTLRPEPLSRAATGQVVRARIPDAADEFADACQRATRGNPFLLHELLGEVVSDGMCGSASEAPNVLDFGSARVARAVRRRLRSLGDEAVALARAVAVLGPGVRLDEAASLATLDVAVAERAADALASADVLGDEAFLEFVHPVVAAAVYEDIAPLERRTLHAAAAELILASGGGPERVALHLLRLPPAADPEAVELLRSAAHEAMARGAAGAAARYLRRALEEPPAEAVRGAVLHELGRAEATDRQRDSFEEHLRAAAAATRNAHTRAEICLDLGRALAASGDLTASIGVLHGALCDLDDPDSGVAVRLEAELLTMGFNDLTLMRMTERYWRRRLRQLRAGDELQPLTLACLVLSLSAGSPPASQALRLADRVLDAPDLDELNSVVAGCVGNGLIFAGDLGRAARFYDARVATATRLGSRLTVAWQLIMRSDASLRLGEVRRAEVEARSAVELLETGSGPSAYAWALAHLVNALVARGALDDAERTFERPEVGPGAPPSFPLGMYLCARSRVHLARGRAGEALDDALHAGELLGPIVSNPACSSWRTDAALALAALERRDEARVLAEEQLADARRFEVAEAVALSLRTVGIVTAGREAVEPLRAALAAAASGECRLEHARCAVELGAALRRAGMRAEARDMLREAVDRSARLGATALGDHAHEELVAAGARPRRDRRLLTGREALTPSEDRVAQLAAEGLTNREIAQRLFVTVKAVQFHLRNVYRKLDVASREDLPTALGEGA